MKLLKPTLCFLLLILSSCSWLQDDEKWRNDFITRQFNGVKNAYGTGEFVYKYEATDDKARESDYFYEHCLFYVYTLRPPTNVKNLQDYLNQFIDRDLQEKIQNDPTAISILPTSRDFFRVKWLYNRDVTKKVFDPIDSIIKEGTWYSQTMYDRYNECLEFFPTNKAIQFPNFAKKYHLDVHEEIRYRGFDKNEVIKVIKNPNTLVKIEAGETSVGIVYFYDSDYKYFITLQFQPSY